MRRKSYWHLLLLALSISPFVSSCQISQFINSVNISARYATPVEKIKGIEYINRKLPGSISLTIRNVDNPRDFSPWDINFKLKPSIHLELLKLDPKNPVAKDPLTGSDRLLPVVTMRRLPFFLNGEFVGHTPLGALSFIYGMGAEYYYANNGEDLRVSRLQSVAKFEFAYTVFLAKRLYFVITTRKFESRLDTASAAIKLGYYFE